MALAHCQASKVYEKQQKNGVFEQSVDTNLLHIIEAKHVSTHIERHFVHPTYLDKRHFGSFDISPPLSVDLLPSLPADSTRNPRGTSAGSSFGGCEENSDPPLHL